MKSLIQVYDKGIFSSISLEEHRRELAILQRRLSEISTNESEFKNLKENNEKLHNEIQNFISEKVSAEEIIKSRVINQFADDAIKVAILVKDLHKYNYLLSIQYDPDEHLEDDPEISRSSEIDEAQSSGEFELTFENIEKSIDIDPKERLEKGTLRSMIEATQESVISDPTHKTTLFLTLLLHKSPSAYSKKPNPELIGLQKDVFETSLSRCLKAKYIDQTSEGYTLTSKGQDFISDFFSNDFAKPLIVIIRGLYERTKLEVLDTLKERHLNIQELAQSVEFNPMLIDIVNELREEKKVTANNGIFSAD